MTVQRTQTTIETERGKIHLCMWWDGASSLRRIIVLVHGLMMHGQSFDALATQLAAQDALVVAPDLRGFGRSYFVTDGQRDKADYLRSLADLGGLLRILVERYGELPLFCAGESLGAHLARGVASLHPELVTGLILSSPCVRPQIVSLPLIPYACSQLMLAGLDREREFDLAPFAKALLKGEPDTLQRYLDDPMARKSLEIMELINSLRIVGSMELQRLSPDIPILVFRGANDCVCKTNSFERFVDSLNSSNLIVHCCKSCGHLILQAPEVNETILDIILRWLDSLSRQNMQDVLQSLIQP